MNPYLVVAALIAALLGALLAWLAGRAATERQRSATAAAEAGAAVQAQALAKREQELATVRAAHEQLRTQLAAVDSERAVLKATLEQERAAVAEGGEAMSLRFKQLSQEILEDKSRRFTEQNQQNLEQILKPLREKIVGFEQQVKQSYDQETRDRVALKTQIEELTRLNQRVSAEANNLAGALRGSTRTRAPGAS